MRIPIRLDQVCEIVMGQAPNGESYNTEAKGFPLIAGAGDFCDGVPAPKKWTTEPTKMSQIGDIVLGIRASIGEKVISDKNYCLGRGVAGLRGSDQLDTRYLWHWLSHVTPELHAKGKGATFKQVNREDIGEICIALPPVKEQRRIAAILDKAEALCAKRREAIAKLNSLEQTIFLDIFGDPVRNPMGWPISKFKEIGSIERGVSKHRPRNAPELLGGPYPFVQTGDVANCDGYVRQYSGSYSDLGLKQSRLWPAGTLCITIAANIAKTGILTFDACFPDSVVGFQAKNKCTVQYVRIWLSFLQKTLEDAAPESAQKNINLEILRNLNIPAPPIELQEKLYLRIIELDRNKGLQEVSEKKLDELFSTLQRICFSV